jgi:hypothetical protein
MSFLFHNMIQRLSWILACTFAMLGSAAVAQPFDQQQELHGISFRVTSPNRAAENTVRIAPAGLQIDNSEFEVDITGVVLGAEVADINADYSPEIYIYVREPGTQKRMSLVAFSANNKKSLSMIYLPPLSATVGAEKGYCGNDDMAVVEGVFLYRFPLCNVGDEDTTSGAKTRQLQYKLAPGEAGWNLKLDKMLDY